MKAVIIDVYELLDNEFAMSADQGEKLGNLIEEALDNSKKVVLDFNRIQVVSTRFINSSIGYFYEPESRFFKKTERIKISIDNPDMEYQIRRGIEKAIDYYKNKDVYIEASEL